MDSAPVFAPFGVAHLIVIALTITLPLVFAAMARRTRSVALNRVFSAAIAALLVVNYVGYIVYRARQGTIDWTEMLPMQLCDWTMFVVIIALATGGRRSWLEVGYFWGIGGSLQAILTPNLQFGFPDFRFLSFFADHCGIVVGVLFLMLSLRFRPDLRSIWRTLIWSEIYLVVTLLVDRLTGVNYGFLLHKPEAFSILSYLSDGRLLYILQMNGLALVFFALLYAPFAIIDLTRAQNETRAT
ncbi:MAG: TIGR02206 family membrane protein [Verrucomicrobiota bacterium]